MPYERVTPTTLTDVLLLEPKVFGDERGFFLESFNQRDFEETIGKSVDFVQDNHSCSQKGVLRGLHYQIKHSQGKIVRVTQGEVFDVVVDLRRSSSSFGQHTSALLNSVNHHQLWIPPGFAHGFLVLSETAEFLYKSTDYWFPEHERTLLWSDPDLSIDWPTENPQLSPKDLQGTILKGCEAFD
ncbi:MAG: dTDP-4-dehydrorhamnose 3,5-epimerase [Deltaproteobacteria bacterium]|nr:dTDP-4-dehydrorhamnose 3,5-epimerase [Deltaproteobacteria bacterium]MBT7205699.1 dTDP-4-dehydrorhamnose 3,5-epimerase [Deltaproteobacteria bacterium]